MMSANARIDSCIGAGVPSMCLRYPAVVVSRKTLKIPLDLALGGGDLVLDLALRLLAGGGGGVLRLTLGGGGGGHPGRPLCIQGGGKGGKIGIIPPPGPGKPGGGGG